LNEDRDDPWADWNALDAADLEDWMRAHRADWPHLPIYQLSDPREAIEAFAPTEFLANGIRVGRAPESGVLLVDVLAGAMIQAEDAHAQFSDAVLALAREEDERSFLPPSQLYVGAEEHATRLLDLPIDVVGPGGRVIVETASHADVVIRRRESAIQSDWRSAGATLRRAPGLLRFDGRIWGRFGYFELSKYELQLHMRPVFLFVIDRPQTEETPGLRTSVVIPATTARDLEDDVGLGSWA
jgi:hypothetical protein